MAKNGERKSSKQRNYNFGKNIEEVHTKEILLEDPKECENEPCMYPGKENSGQRKKRVQGPNAGSCLGLSGACTEDSVPVIGWEWEGEGDQK